MKRRKIRGGTKVSLMLRGGSPSQQVERVPALSLVPEARAAKGCSPTTAPVACRYVEISSCVPKRLHSANDGIAIPGDTAPVSPYGLVSSKGAAFRQTGVGYTCTTEWDQKLFLNPERRGSSTSMTVGSTISQLRFARPPKALMHAESVLARFCRSESFENAIHR
jgi:hypothetical protein